MVGVALTVKTRCGDNLMIHERALDMAGEGDILVIANEQGRERSLLGEIMYRQGERKKLAGIVLDAPIRDSLGNLQRCPSSLRDRLHAGRSI
ncbi:hypothetical protein MASR2M79_02990 [Aminivibrio sp.]